MLWPQARCVMENLNLTDEQGNIIKGVTRKTKSGVGIKRTRLKGSVKTR